jgi:hypothetical protein
VFSLSGSAQLYLPIEDFYTGEAYRLAIKDSSKTENYFKNHLSLKPILDKRTSTEKITHSDEKYYYWITQKLFKEHFLILEGEDFWCAIDPILDLEFGTDFSADSLERLSWNSRGIRIQAKFLDKVAFSTSFYETQAYLPGFINSYVNAHGEFQVNSTGTIYQQVNAVIPGFSRTKAFKVNGYDFSMAEGQVSIVPNQFFNVQFGNGNQFIGGGERSLLLSDFSANYPFAKFEANLLKGRIQYNTIYALHQNLYRIPFNTTPEATFERKIGAYHYLDFAMNENLQIGLFEGSHWRRSDSAGTHTPDFNFINPVVGANTTLKGFEQEGYKSIIGLNFSYFLNSMNLYGQVVFSAVNKGGYQIGMKYFNLFTDGLDFTAEYNHVTLNAYLSSEKRYNYSNYNLALAHPLTAGFDELIFKLSYQANHFFVQNKLIYSAQIKNNDQAIGNYILAPKSTAANNNNYQQNRVFNNLEIGYRFNKNYNFQFVLGHIYRNEEKISDNPLTNYTYIGLRTRLRNKNFNF